MNAKKNITLFLTLFFLGALLISLIIMRLLFLKHPSMPLSPNKIVLAFANSATYKSYDERGYLQSNIKVTSFQYYKKNGQSIFQYPKGWVYTKKRIPWYIRANHGQAFHTKDWIDLNGHVIMHQLPYPNHPETIIRTESVRIYPAAQTAETDQWVSIQQQKNQLQGLGMKANLGEGMIDILSQTQGYYHPHTPND